jgi:hypothetical protein
VVKAPVDTAELLQQIYMAGFELETFDLYPKAIGVVRGECIALLVPAQDGLQILGSPGWKVAGRFGVLTSAKGKPIFQSKADSVEATDERVAALKQFESDLRPLIRPVQ